jgi:hypothetical protein
MIIHYRNHKDTGVRGLQPYLYRETPSESMNREAYFREYSLCTGDSFEFGKPAYSLHTTLKSAEKFKYFDWWVPGLNVRKVFVSKKTLETISKKRDGRRRSGGAFISLED